MRHRNRVLGLLSLLMVITYLDRVCISVAGPRIQDSLHIGYGAGPPFPYLRCHHGCSSQLCLLSTSISAACMPALWSAP